MKNKHRLIPLILGTIILIWGLAWVYMKLGLNYMSVLTFSTLRFLIGTITLFIISLFIKRKQLSYKNIGDLLILGISQTSIVFFLVMYGLQFIGAGKAAMLLYSMPVWSAVFSVLLLNETVSKRKVVGLTVGFSGLIIILGVDFLFSQNKSVLIGELLIVVAAIAWGFANIYYRKHLANIPIIQVSAYQMMFGTIGLFIATLLIESSLEVHWTLKSIYYIGFTGILASAVAFTLWYYVLQKVNTITATVSTMLVPVLGLILSYFIIGEALAINVFLGALLILTGLYITQTKEAGT